jgi:hypothetical protein
VKKGVPLFGIVVDLAVKKNLKRRLETVASAKLEK